MNSGYIIYTDGAGGTEGDKMTKQEGRAMDAVAIRMKLSDCRDMMYAIARAQLVIAKKPEYKCMMAGKPVIVTL